MKNLQSNKIVAISFLLLTIAFFSCKKDDSSTSLADKLENNTLMFNGKKLNVYASGKTNFVASNCGGQGLVGTLYLGAGNADRDTVILTVQNLSGYTGTSSMVEYGLPGNACKASITGQLKLSGTSTFVSIKSGYDGVVQFDGNVSLFRESSIGVNVPPKLFTVSSPQISYDCYWKCTF
jgi:hypothetical protein